MNDALQATSKQAGTDVKLGGTAPTTIKTADVSFAPQGAVKDSGRVHMGGGMIHY